MDNRTEHPPVFFSLYIDGEQVHSWQTADRAGELDRGTVEDEPRRLQFENLTASNGETCSGPLNWLNRCAVQLDPEHDAIQLSASVGDPRGAFCIEIRRLDDGQIVLHFPHPGESLPHMNTREHHPGTLEIVGHEGRPMHFEEHQPALCRDCDQEIGCEDCDDPGLLCKDCADDETTA